MPSLLKQGYVMTALVLSMGAGRACTPDRGLKPSTDTTNTNWVLTKAPSYDSTGKMLQVEMAPRQKKPGETNVQRIAYFNDTNGDRKWDKGDVCAMQVFQGKVEYKEEQADPKDPSKKTTVTRRQNIYVRFPNLDRPELNPVVSVMVSDFAPTNADDLFKKGGNDNKATAEGANAFADAVIMSGLRRATDRLLAPPVSADMLTAKL